MVMDLVNDDERLLKAVSFKGCKITWPSTIDLSDFLLNFFRLHLQPKIRRLWPQNQSQMAAQMRPSNSALYRRSSVSTLGTRMHRSRCSPRWVWFIVLKSELTYFIGRTSGMYCQRGRRTPDCLCCVVSWRRDGTWIKHFT